jgi:hypothetical protein
MPNKTDDLARLKLMHLLNTYHSMNTDSIGTLRSLLTPEDTLAFPPKVLDTPVLSNPISLWLQNNLGQYYDRQKKISLSSQVWAHKLNRLRLLGLGTPYETLLHEAGHAREHAASGLNSDQRFIGNEKYADALADSLIKARGY